MPRLAIIGAGLAGLTCARTLHDAGHTVHLFDKARGPGGRLATRRVQAAGTTLQFDHGCPTWDADDAPHGLPLAPWQPPTPGGSAATLRVGTPRMSAIPRALAAGLDLSLNQRVTRVHRSTDGYTLTTDDGTPHPDYHAVAVNTPAPQAAPLLREVAPALAVEADAAPMHPCWALLVTLAEPPTPDWAWSHTPDGNTLALIAHDSAKPDRPLQRAGPSCWVAHATPRWSSRHLEDDATAVADQLLNAFRARLGAPLSVTAAKAHRWRYAHTTHSLGDHCLWSPKARVGACGDWCAAGGVQGALTSGQALAERLLAAL